MNNIPNILSVFRIILAPVLLLPAWCGQKNIFIILLIIALLTDALDGFIARKFNATSAAGAKLDSMGDMAVYLIIPVCVWWLWPEIIKREALYVAMAVCGYFFPLVAGIVKFRKIPSYHTYGAKAAAVVMSVAMLFLFMTDFNTLFRIAAIFQAFVAIEEIAITIKLPKLKSDVKSIWHLREQHTET